MAQQTYRSGGQRAGGRVGGTTTTEGRQFSGRQTGMQQPGGQQQGVSFGDALTGEMRVALMDFVRSAEVCEWCADQCIAEASPELVECARLCRDVADLALLNVQLLGRQSPFGAGVAEDFVEAAEACAAECAQHPHAHCQECARVLGRAVRSTGDLLRSVGREVPQRGQLATA